MPLQSVIVDVVTPPPTVVQVVYQTASDGVDGTDGLSAYQLAVAGGFIGTQQDWLESLAAAPPPPGEDGQSAYDIAVQNGFVGSQVEWLASLQGADADAAAIAAETHGADAKTTPVDADEIGLVDSAASWGWKRLSWANLKAAIKAFLTPAEIGAIPASGGTMTNGTLAGTTTATTIVAPTGQKLVLRSGVTGHVEIEFQRSDGTVEGYVSQAGYLYFSHYAGASEFVLGTNKVGLGHTYGIDLANDQVIGWTNTGHIYAALATAISMVAPGHLAIGTGAVGSTAGILSLTNLNAAGTISPGPKTVAAANALSGTPTGALLEISDESGGATTARWDGTNWRRIYDRAIIS